MNRLIKKMIHKELFAPRLKPLSFLFTPIYSGIGSILMFHRVIEDDAPLVCEDLEITASYLEEVICYFSEKGYEFVAIDEAYQRIKHPKAKQRKFVAFTFDDGYLDNLTVAYPIFKKYQVPFTIYVTTSFPDRTANLWWYALKDLVTQKNSIQFSIKGKPYSFSTLTEEEKTEGYHTIRNLIVATKGKDLTDVLDSLFEGTGIDCRTYVDKLALTWEQINLLSQDRLVTIGAHTTNHYNLKQLDLKDLKKEVMDSKRKIERTIQKEVAHFAYPFGSDNEAGDREFQVLKNLGFKTSTTTRCANIFPHHQKHQTSLPRLTLSPYLSTPHLQYYATGFLPALTNRFKRIVTS